MCAEATRKWTHALGRSNPDGAKTGRTLCYICARLLGTAANHCREEEARNKTETTSSEYADTSRRAGIVAVQKPSILQNIIAAAQNTIFSPPLSAPLLWPFFWPFYWPPLVMHVFSAFTNWMRLKFADATELLRMLLRMSPKGHSGGSEGCASLLCRDAEVKNKSATAATATRGIPSNNSTSRMEGRDKDLSTVAGTASGSPKLSTVATKTCDDDASASPFYSSSYYYSYSSCSYFHYVFSHFRSLMATLLPATEHKHRPLLDASGINYSATNKKVFPGSGPGPGSMYSHGASTINSGTPTSKSRPTFANIFSAYIDTALLQSSRPHKALSSLRNHVKTALRAIGSCARSLLSYAHDKVATALKAIHSLKLRGIPGIAIWTWDEAVSVSICMTLIAMGSDYTSVVSTIAGLWVRMIEGLQ